MILISFRQMFTVILGLVVVVAIGMTILFYWHSGDSGPMQPKTSGAPTKTCRLQGLIVEHAAPSDPSVASFLFGNQRGFAFSN